jgi:hypothetical protein
LQQASWLDGAGALGGKAWRELEVGLHLPHDVAQVDLLGWSGETKAALALPDRLDSSGLASWWTTFIRWLRDIPYAEEMSATNSRSRLSSA